MNPREDGPVAAVDVPSFVEALRRVEAVLATLPDDGARRRVLRALVILLDLENKP